MKLFSISSPLIFYFAQNIALDLKSQDNLSLLWYSGGHENHLNTYHILKNTEIWSKEIVFEAAVRYNGLNFAKILNPQKTLKEKKEVQVTLSKIIEENNITEIFIANRYMPFDRLLYTMAIERNIKVNLLEDGLTNYLDFKYSDDNSGSILSKNQLKQFIKKKLFKEKQLQYIFLSKEEPIFNDVYASFPKKYYHRNYTSELYELNLSDYNDSYYEKVCPLLKKDPVYQLLMDENKKNILFLSQALSEDDLIKVDDEVFSIVKSLKKYSGSDYMVFIKPHPRDNEHKLKTLEKNLRSIGVDVYILQNEIPIPVEVLLVHMNLSEIIGVWTAALVYSYTIDNRIKNTSILPHLCDASNNDNLTKVYKKLTEVFKEEVTWGS